MWSGEDERQEPERCHVCDEQIVADDIGGRGLLVFPRGDDVEYEEPALCRRCSHAIGATALFRFWAEEEDG